MNHHHVKPVIVDIGAPQTRQIILGSTVAGVLGIITLVSSFTGNVSGGALANVIGAVLGSVCTLIGVLPIVLWRVTFRPRKLIFDAAGIRWDDPHGSSWQVRWEDLSRVVFSRPTAQQVRAQRDPLGMHLDLYLDEQRFPNVRPDMKHLILPRNSGKNIYHLPLAHTYKLIGPVERGLTTFAPHHVYSASSAPSVKEATEASVTVESHDNTYPSSRPPAVVIAVALVTAYWVAAVTFAVVTSEVSWKPLLGIAVWTVIIGVWFMRVLAGGARAVETLRYVCLTFGVLFCVGTLLLAFFVFKIAEIAGDYTSLFALIPAVAANAVFLSAGFLLRRQDVRSWCEAKSLGR